MPIRDKEDGTLSYEYDLFVKPCPMCSGTDLVLYENGGRKVTKGGAMCKICFFKVERDDIPGVPTMTMLLEVWNNHIIELEKK